MIRFAVLFEGRTGSSYLLQCLNSHPAIRMWGEIFAPLRKREDSLPKRIREQQKTFEEHILTPPDVPPGITALGFKTKLRDVLDPPAFARELHSHSFRIIRMKRRNTIKQVISGFNMRRLHEETGEYNSPDPGPWQKPFRADPVKFRERHEALLKHEEKLEAFVRTLDLPVLEVFYEDFLADAGTYFGNILDFLQVPRRKLRGRLRKLTPDNLEEIILNLDELAAQFRDTPWEGMFYENAAPPACL